VRRAAATIVAFIVAALAAFGAIVIVFPFGLVLHEAIIYPLAMCVSGVFGALGAGWIGTILRLGGGRTRLLPVAGVTVGVAAVLAVAVLLFLSWAESQRPAVFTLNPFQVAVVVPVVIALAAVLAVSRLRTAAATLRRDVLTTLGLLVVSVLSVPAAIVLGAQFGLAGA
jgi:hypothetical protein